MVATNVKSETMALMDKRSALEAEMNAIIDRLCQPGGPGLSGNLVDSEGFPRSDIDIPVVRAERHRLSELRNDHKVTTEKIDQNIQILHSSRLASRSSPPKESVQGKPEGPNNQNSPVVSDVPSASSHNVVLRDSSSDMDVDVMASIPFAMVDEIADASPAAEDGLQLGDQIIKFGNVEAGENLLQRLASEAQTNQGCAIPVVIMRQGAPINLTVTPRTWQGRGLLGCHFRIL
nr:26S proteasome non-ATPase regulatory subunit 9-like [Quercus suber]POF10168.1 26s proteasome non-atpase regulatory subunit 9 [Quercus suber]